MFCFFKILCLCLLFRLFSFVEHLLSLVILRNFVGDVAEVEEVENQFHKMFDIFH
jgi:hypothetical protein